MSSSSVEEDENGGGEEKSGEVRGGEDDRRRNFRESEVRAEHGDGGECGDEDLGQERRAQTQDGRSGSISIKREISIMKIVRHPYIVRLHEVLSSRAKIYIILEFVTGGELFDEIVHQGRLSEKESRRYFQQLIDAVSHCHSKGVYHRDLKPENLLLDSRGNLKVSDFGLSALPKQGVDLLHTTCGTPNYVAPEVLSSQGYDGAAADIWSCGVILFVLMAGYLPFEELDLPTLYQKINAAEFICPFWFSPAAKSLIDKILDPNPKTRITIEEIKGDPWFVENYVPVGHEVEEEVNLDDVRAVFEDIEDQYVIDSRNEESGPLVMNAFEMINLSQGLNLSALFDRRQGEKSNALAGERVSGEGERQEMKEMRHATLLLMFIAELASDYVKSQTRFVSRQPAKVIISTIETVGESMGFKVHTRSYKTRLEGLANMTGQFAVVLEVYEVAPSLFMVDARKAAGGTLEYHKFYKSFVAKLEHIIWKPRERIAHSSLMRLADSASFGCDTSQ
ncbi:CBL-interacting serine/threonine-protein kinase 24-like protein [Drosera capensis]